MLIKFHVPGFELGTFKFILTQIKRFKVKVDRRNSIIKGRGKNWVDLNPGSVKANMGPEGKYWKIDLLRDHP